MRAAALTLSLRVRLRWAGRDMVEPLAYVLRMYYTCLMFAAVDWSHGAAHMWNEHRVTVAEANEALNDPDAVVLDPDPKSKSGRSVRVIGWSGVRGDVLTVLVVRDQGTVYGVNGWVSNPTDQRNYREQEL